METKEKKPKAPKVEEEKKAKPVKAIVIKSVKIMSDELAKLELAKSTLASLIDAKKAADIAELELECAKDRAKDRKGAYQTARLKEHEIIEAYLRPLPLFDGAKKPEVKSTTIAKAAVDAMTDVDLSVVRIVPKKNPVGVAVGLDCSILSVLPGGVTVLLDGRAVELADSEYEIQVGNEEIAAARAKPKPKPKPSTAWQSLPVSEIGVTGKMAEKLADAGIQTLGELSNAQARGEWWAEKIKGIGPGAAEKIGDGWIAFWQRRPEFCA